MFLFSEFKDINIKQHTSKKITKKGLKTFLVRNHIRKIKDRNKDDNKKKIIVGTVGAIGLTAVLGGIALLNPNLKNKIFNKKIDLDLDEKLFQIDTVKNPLRLIKKFKQNVKSVFPKKTLSNNYTFDLNEDNLRKELKMWRDELNQFSEGFKKGKYDIQKEMFEQFQRIDFKRIPDEFPVGFRDTKGKLKGFTILRPNLDVDALEMSNFAIKDDATDLMRDIFKTNVEVSKKLGFKGKLYGAEASSYAELLYRRLGAKKFEDGYLYTPDLTKI